MKDAYLVRPGAPTGGLLRVPGDKSISHRALLIGAIAEGHTEVTGFLAGQDCLATLAALQAMGVPIRRPAATTVRIDGVGLHGLRPSPAPLDMGNSGTAMRLFAGLLAAQAFDSVLTGDASLSRRPMARVADPLREMGAVIGTNEGLPPLRISGGRRLRGIDYAMPVASAQVKSALLLAGLYAEGTTTVREPAPTRDHTERMLRQFGVSLDDGPGWVRVGDVLPFAGGRVAVPGDLSSASFFLLAGCLAAGGEVVIDGVGLNPTRTGILRILELMGADITVEEAREPGHAEPVGRLTARPSSLQGIEVPPELVPLAIDEFPVIFVAAALAEGETTIRGAAELRHKESDRIAVMLDGLRSLGVEVEESPDGARIRGGRLGGGSINSAGDHRVAMAFAVAACRASGPVRIEDTANVATSFPGFVEQARTLGLTIEVQS